MARSFHDELDAYMRAGTEQIPEWHDAMADPSDEVTVRDALGILNGGQGLHRNAILKIADEIDRLPGKF